MTTITPTPIPSPRAPKSRIKGDARRAKFLEAATAIILEHGVSAVTMEEVALRTDVNKRLGYRYFANREELLCALFELKMAEVTRCVAAAMPAEPSLADIISINIRVWMDLTDRDGPVLSRLFSDQDVIPEMAREIVDRSNRNWARTLQDTLTMPPAAAETLARILLTGVRGAVEALGAATASAEQIAEIYAVAALASAQAVAAQSRPATATDATA